VSGIKCGLTPINYQLITWEATTSVYEDIYAGLGLTEAPY